MPTNTNTTEIDVDATRNLIAAVRKQNRAAGGDAGALTLAIEAERLLDRIAQLEAELLDDLSQAYLKSAGPSREGGFEVTVEPSRRMMLVLASHLIALLEADAGINYVEWDVKPAGQLDPYRLILVRPGGKSPHELRVDAERALAVALAERDDA